MNKSQKTDDEEEHDGYNVVDEVSPADWVDYDTERWDEFVHVVVDTDNRKMRCYRTVNDDFPSERVKTTIEEVHFRFSFDGEEKEISHFYLTWQEAETFLTFIDLLAKCREENPEELFISPVNLQWYENNEKPANSESNVNDETISLQFTKQSGTTRSVQIMDTWVDESNQMARYKE